MTMKTTIQNFPRLAVVGLAALVLSAGFAPEASANCGPFPRIPLWESLSHDLVRQQVDEIHGGDWQAYLAKLERYEDKLRGIQKKGTGAVVTWKNRKIQLKDEAIEVFLSHVDRRIAVTRCLAEADDVANFSTAPGGTDGDAAVTADAGAETAASRQCAPIPKVAWWKFKSHESVTGYVLRKHRGDWRDYIDTWSRRLAKLQEIYGRGSSVVTKTGVLLKGPKLADYIGKMQTRISVTRCLANKGGGSDT